MKRQTLHLIHAGFSALAFVIGSAHTIVLVSAAQNSVVQPVFGVKDSIEIAYIANPTAYSSAVELRDLQATGNPIVSPDQRRFLLITQRGLLLTNRIEATIWVFDRNAVLAYAREPSTPKPMPRAVAVMSATSNTPVISDVRWLEDSNRVSFLGKKDGPNSQLFVVDVTAGSLAEVTEKSVCVVAYDIERDAIAYSTLVPFVGVSPIDSEQTSEDLVDVTGRDIYSLLDSSSHDGLADYVDEWSLRRFPTVLHVLEHGNELVRPITIDGIPLRLFAPIFHLSPDGRSLIAVGPVREIPKRWEAYNSRLPGESYRFRVGDKWMVNEQNPNKAEQYLSIDIESGVASVLIDAPAGRGLGYTAPTGVIWSADGRRVLVSNTFLPIDNVRDRRDRINRSQTPALAIVDVASRKIQPVTYMTQPLLRSDEGRRITHVSWDEAKGQVRVTYAGTSVMMSAFTELYALKEGAWLRAESDVPKPNEQSDEIELVVDEDLDHPPALTVHRHKDSSIFVVWDPNPQLKGMSLGHASLYRWKDSEGHSWEGVLVVPTSYTAGGHYPLVIQTHGYNATRFFADGQYTTGSGGRALVGLGIAVLQIDMPMELFGTPNDGPFQIGGFESAIADLAKNGLVDAKRVGIVGFSYTCFHVMYALAHRPNLFAAATTTDGNEMTYSQYLMATDYSKGSASGFQELLEGTNGGSPFGTGLLDWFQRAPSFNLDRVTTPLLMSALSKEERLGQWEIYAALRKLRKPVRMLWLTNANVPHILVKPRERYLSQQMTVDWFDYWLNGHENPSPDKAEQYSRWHGMRQTERKGANARDRLPDLTVP